LTNGEPRLKLHLSRQAARQDLEERFMWSKSAVQTAVLPIAAAAVLALVPGDVRAHHGTGASYYQDQMIQITGKVTEFAWKNPHSQLFIDVTDGPFKGQNYAVELNSPGVMIRQGWTKKQFQPGDNIVIAVHPSKAGAPVGECLSCTVTINGKEVKPR
jgi:hypothetical protein